jgi:DNA-3-methyladenine glycosylase
VTTRAFFRRSVHEIAPRLIGAELLVDGVGGRIVELEAYDHTEAASHGYLNRRTARNGSMFLDGGHVYVYRSYGIHWCLNIVCGDAGVADALLIRALEPTRGIEAMRRRRDLDDVRLLCAGPGRLCQALDVTGELDGRAVDEAPFAVTLPRAKQDVVTGTRIGITKAADLPWRYAARGSRFVSRPLRA